MTGFEFQGDRTVARLRVYVSCVPVYPWYAVIFWLVFGLFYFQEMLVILRRKPQTR